MSLSFTLSASFNVNLGESIETINEETIKNNIMPIHFSDNGNDFGWLLYIKSVDNIDTGSNSTGKVTITSTWDYVECEQQIRWLYYNSERWERLWPLDDNMKQKLQSSQGWLNMSGWLYTKCVSSKLANALYECLNWSGVADEDQCEADARATYGTLNWYYGMLNYVYDNQTFGLIAWAQYTGNGDWLAIDNTKTLKETFIRLNDKYPIGLIYDYHGWLWFVWCEFIGNKAIGLRNLVNKLNSWISLSDMFVETGENSNSIQYVYDTDIQMNCDNVGSMVSPSRVIVEWLAWYGKGTERNREWSDENPRMQRFWLDKISNTVLINYARKRAEILCRGKWTTDTVNNNLDVNCLDLEWISRVIDAVPWRTYIVKNGSVRVNAMDDFGNDDNYYDIFIDKWNLLLDNDLDNGLKKVFTNQWFISTNNDITWYKDEIMQSINNSLNYTGDDVAVGVFIKWNFIVNWNLQSSDGEKINSRYFVYWKLTTKDSKTDLDELFSWGCDDDWLVHNEVEKFCPHSDYKDAYLIVIDQNYTSPLFN